jgi:hypothetical protein
MLAGYAIYSGLLHWYMIHSSFAYYGEAELQDWKCTVIAYQIFCVFLVKDGMHACICTPMRTSIGLVLDCWRWKPTDVVIIQFGKVVVIFVPACHGLLTKCFDE